ncbi:phage tail sheath subtilisin-like domain-containing protein [Paraburkholderia caballeronis]|uniref:Mu-like prophage tail sheath protein gpL n=1 Tax=Paraburkholderia caballeronis TaxID=416943 RepID=A0A1H7U0Z9_9BURK|nr:phage tail sheath subtilisin-like domain-containing protein [Paraburkholderia caballeronis]PXW23408.1 phage tail sheath gpL-like [Paraburkholderia caballeronis]PXW98401.1 phage tail sheath gpL-like [Paraburkholderia caballeronis]RAJ95132.1 phage tail sheath gpL-like [Paraburkholderia caballeronis]SEC55230.1 Mu-like prophage tail sheath protein gpL [Paraburkholderia caballeronis]SEL89917.1 Mu-like prophage tail sheath protein gpL [Paraburkholderia caballeronis]
MGDISFPNIPQNLRVPLFYADIDPSRANTGQQTQRALIIGQMLASGTGIANTPQISQGVSDAKSVGGRGSMLALMTAAYRARDTFGEVWYLPLSDGESSVAAAGSLTFASAATATGVLSLYIAGQLVSLVVTSTMTVSQLATALVAQITALPDLPVTAAVDGTTPAKVNITAKNKGLAGNDIDIQLNYRGAASGETTPAGLTATIVAMAAGATNPDLTTALANLGDQEFDFIAMPYTDATSLDAMKAFLSTATGRWSWSKQIYGGGYAAYRGTLGDLTTFGVTRNDEHMSIMGFNGSPTPAWVIAADITAAVAVSARADPAQPLQTVTLATMLAPPLPSRFELTDRNTLLYDGISTFTVADDGTIAIENLITTYQKNSFGDPDDSYLEVETMNTLTYVLRQLKSVVTSKYARKKLAADGTRVLPGTNVITPSMIRADLVAQYQTMEENGYVQGSAVFAQGLVVQQNSQNPNRVDVLYPAILIDQLRIFALLMQFMNIVPATTS